MRTLAEAVAQTRAGCVFCRMWDRVDPRPRDWWTYPNGYVARLVPLNPVVYGHVLFVPKIHVEDVGDLPDWSARVMRCAADYVRGLDAANIITSKGAAASQTVLHLHVHVIPRKAGDDLKLPWTGQVDR